jgi:hypothetical protein
MCEQNRVTPLGDVEAFPLRGAFTGNRGRLHEGRRIVRFHTSNLWIICALDFLNRWNEQWLPRRFTWLFFHDEAVALAAGHRPCAECRHGSYVAYRDAWAEAASLAAPPSALDINRQLHAERLVSGTHRRRLHRMPWSALPDGTFVVDEDGSPHLIHEMDMVRWTQSGYGAHRRRPLRGRATVITPPSTVAALRAGYPVCVDKSALS